MINNRIGIIFFTLLFLSEALHAQKAELKLVQYYQNGNTEIRIVDEGLNIIFDGSLTPLQDSTFFNIEYDKRFFVQLSNYKPEKKDTLLFSLHLNGTPIIVIHSDIDPGDHSWPFTTGIDKPKLRIVGGSSVSIEDYPWQVFVRAGDFLCGGTIIADKWVLTAAHCLFDDANVRIPDEEISFTVGIDRPFSVMPNGQRYPIEFSVIHEDYNGVNFESDLALLRTADVIEDEAARPINLVTEDDVSSGATDPGVNAIITGWGLTNVDPLEFPERLQKLDVPVVSKSVAELVWGPLPDNMLMAGYIDDRGDACSGDSGGPLIVEVNGEYKIAGIISWGSSGCNTIGGYTRVSSFLEWIEKNSGVGQDQFRTVRAKGDDFRCQGTDIAAENLIYISDTLADATDYEWKIEPEEAGSLTSNENSAEVSWSEDFIGEAYISVRALTSEGFTNWGGQRVETGRITKIITEFQDTSVCQLLDLSFEVEAEGTDLTYNWLKDGGLVQSGPDPIYFLEELRIIDEGFYQVEVLGRCGLGLTTPAELTVLPETQILNITQDNTVEAGSPFQIEAVVVGDKVEYTWQKDDLTLEGENNTTLQFENSNAINTGVYSLSAQGTCGADISRPVYIYVDPGIDEFPEGINIWPTLTRDFVNIAVETDEIFDVYIYDSMGKFLGRKVKCRYKATLDFSSYSADMYIVQVQFDRSVNSFRVVKLNN